MAQREVIQSWLFLAATLLASASAQSMMPYSIGIMGYRGMGGYGGGGMRGSHVGSSYRKGNTFGGKTSQGSIPPAIYSPTALNGVERFFDAQDQSLVEGLTVTIEPASSSKSKRGHHVAEGMFGALAGAGMYGGGLGYGGFGGYGGGASGMYGMGAMGGLYGLGSNQLEATIEILKAADFMTQPAVIVFTESAVTSSTGDCPLGPVLTQPTYSDSGVGGLGFAGSSHMLGGYGSPRMGMDMGMGLGGDPDFGVIAEVTLKPGFNTFTIQGLGPFTDIDQLAGHGASVCQDVQIGIDGRPVCLGPVYGCVKLGYTSEPEQLLESIP